MIDVAQQTFPSINPATGEKIAEYPSTSPAETDRRLDAAVRASQALRTTTAQKRGDYLRGIARILRRDVDSLAKLAVLEMGKPLVEARAEIEKCALSAEYYASTGAEFLANVAVASDAGESYIAYRPLGAILAIMPWNFPYWQVARFAFPALLAGNAALLKPAPNVCGTALALERVYLEAGVPPGVFASLLLDTDAIGTVIDDRRIAGVTLTGSERAGKSVAARAGAALKKSVLELGGSDAFIVCADADVARAAEVAVTSRFQNCGQSCIAAKRFFVEASVYDEFVRAFLRGVQALIVGDPMLETTKLGPMARPDLRDLVVRQTSASIALGATVLHGGHSIPGPGAYFEPTVLTDLSLSDAPALNEEVFGPVAPIVRVHDVEEAILLANGSQYGLGGNLWTSDIARAKRLAPRFESGGLFINGMTHSDARLPFGGIKQSGYGRELSSFGMHEFMNIQTVWIAKHG